MPCRPGHRQTGGLRGRGPQGPGADRKGLHLLALRGRGSTGRGVQSGAAWSPREAGVLKACSSLERRTREYAGAGGAGMQGVLGGQGAGQGTWVP